MTADLPVVVIGGGPVGLAAAAHLLERGLQPLVLEQGDEVASAVRDWGHVRLFSPWRYDVDAAAARLLAPTGWVRPAPDELPTGAELVERYLAPLAATPELAPHVRTGTRVLAVTRQGVDKARTVGRDGRPYVVRTLRGGEVVDVLGRAVLDASGTWGHPNPLGAGGLAAVGERESAPWLAGPLPDVLVEHRGRFAGRHTLVVGMGHSAANTLLALVRLRQEEPGTEITWAIRGRSPSRLYGGGDADGLPARGLLGSELRAAVAAGAVRLVREFILVRFDVPDDDSGPLGVVGIGRDGEAVEMSVDAVVGAAGFRPDLELLREVRLSLDPVVEAPVRLAPLIDPNHHSCGTVPPHGEEVLAHPDAGFYVVGMKSYGRAPTFLLATGYEQVRSIAAALAGDRAAADRVQLDLPETGVCSVDLAAQEAARPRGVGFATGSEHGWSGAEPVQVGCCGAGEPAGAGAPAARG